MKVKILHGFRGKETDERYIEPGQEYEFDDEIAQRLIDNRQAEAVEVIEPEPKPMKGRGRR